MQFESRTVTAAATQVDCIERSGVRWGMEYLIGAILSLAVFTFALIIGLDRDRVSYPTLLVAIATYYILFAVMGTSVHAILVES